MTHRRVPRPPGPFRGDDYPALDEGIFSKFRHKNSENWLKVRRLRSFNPNSAAATVAKSEEQTFHGEANGFLPLIGHRSSVLCVHIQIP
jgi:hypothetical protein